MQDERAVGKFVEVRFVEPALTGVGDQAFHMKLIVDCVGAVLARVKL